MHRIALALTVIGFVTGTLAHSETRSMRLTSKDVAKIGAELFPDLCGPKGDWCGYAYSDRAQTSCPLEMWLSFPQDVEGPQPTGIWIGLDRRKRPVAMSSHVRHGQALCVDHERRS
jgi:hypothetical protein